MSNIKKLADGIGGVYDLVMGQGLKTPSDQVIRDYTGLYIHSILVSRV
ncbi:hypothetical protein ACFLUG_01910 [Chloroflexota bacterium]